MLSKMQANDAAYTHRHSFGLVADSIQIALQVAAMDHHAAVKSAQEFLFLRKSGEEYQQEDCRQNQSFHSLPSISLRRAA